MLPTSLMQVVDSLKKLYLLVYWFEVSNCKLYLGSNQWVNTMSFKINLIDSNGHNYGICCNIPKWEKREYSA